MNDPVILVAIVGTYANAAAAIVAVLLWNQYRNERYLLFWGLFWTLGTVRWIIHLPATSSPSLRMAEVGVVVPLMFFFNALGSYDLLPTKPWTRRYVVFATASFMLAYGAVANMVSLTTHMTYALAAGTYFFGAACTWRAYRATRLFGYAFTAATFLGWGGWFVIGLFMLGGGIAKSIVGPLFNIPLAFGLLIIAFQRRGRQIAESEHTLQKIFDTAPTPLVIVRPPRGEIERANPIAFEMLGISAEAAIGKTVVELGLLSNSTARQAIYAELQSGHRVNRQELVMLRAGREQRTVSITADRIALDSGDRYIISFYDLTDLRRAENELRASGEEMRQLYVRLANVEDDERRALHAELHDQVGANLAALRLELDIATSLLARNDVSGTQRHLSSAREVTIESIAMARDLMAELRPPALDDFGLSAALRTLAESQSMRLNLPIDVTGGDLAPRPNHLVEGALFRIAQEAVINAARHASASRIAICIGEREGEVALTIEDDGVGFDLNAPAAGPDHWGLKNMLERARAVGGVLRIESALGAGTRITAQVPLEAALKPVLLSPTIILTMP